MQSTRTLIRDAIVISMDSAVGNHMRANILIEGERIVAVGPDLEYENAVEIDASGKIVIPGLIDTHRHVWQSILRFTAADWSHADYFHGVRSIMGDRFGPDEMYAANLSGAVEALDSGITTLLDWCHNANSPAAADAAIAGLRDSGLRSVFAYGGGNDEWCPVPNDRPLSEDIRRIRSEHFSSSDQLSTLAVCLRGPVFSNASIAKYEFDMARDVGAPIHVTVGSGQWSASKRPVEVMRELGLLGPDVTYVHCNTISDLEIKYIADSGGTAAISPEVEMSMGLGYPATGRLLAQGVVPTPSVDIVSFIRGDLFSVMRAAIAAERLRVHQEAFAAGSEVTSLDLTAETMLRAATIDAARAVSLEHRIGSITPGKDADLVVIATDSAAMHPVNNPIGSVVYGASASDVETVLVAGRVVKDRGAIQSVDTTRVNELATSARDSVVQGTRFDPGFDWSIDSSAWGALH